MIPPDPITGRLMPGERIVWQGQPKQGLLLTARDIYLIPASVLWCSFAIFWTIMATGTGGPGFLTLWGLMFVCVGLYLVFGRFIADAWVRRDLHYTLTNQRILITRPAPFRRFTVLRLDQLGDIDLNERSDGRGTIRFGQPVAMWGNRGMSAWSASLDPTPQFLAIEGARRVFDLIQRAQAG